MITRNQMIMTELNTPVVQFANFDQNYENGSYLSESPKSPIKYKEMKDWNTVAATQIILFLIFVFGIFFAIIMYCKTCSRASNRRCSEHTVYENECNDENMRSNTSQCYTIFESRVRPPPYSEVCGAPPLYGSPFNRASMLEAPPVYPDTPKLLDRMSHRTNQAFPVVQHV